MGFFGYHNKGAILALESIESSIYSDIVAAFLILDVCAAKLLECCDAMHVMRALQAQRTPQSLPTKEYRNSSRNLQV